MDKNLRSASIVAGMLLVCFTGMCVCVAIQSNRIQDLKADLVTARTLKQEQDSYLWELQKRFALSIKRSAEAELWLNVCLEEVGNDQHASQSYILQ